MAITGLLRPHGPIRALPGTKESAMYLNAVCLEHGRFQMKPA